MCDSAFEYIYVFKTAYGTVGIVKAEDASDAAKKVAELTRECVALVVRAENIDNKDVIILSDILGKIQWGDKHII